LPNHAQYNPITNTVSLKLEVPAAHAILMMTGGTNRSRMQSALGVGGTTNDFDIYTALYDALENQVDVGRLLQPDMVRELYPMLGSGVLQ